MIMSRKFAIAIQGNGCNNFIAQVDDFQDVREKSNNSCAKISASVQRFVRDTRSLSVKIDVRQHVTRLERLPYV